MTSHVLGKSTFLALRLSLSFGICTEVGGLKSFMPFDDE